MFNNFKLVIFMSCLIFLFMFIGQMIGGRNGMMVAFTLSIAMNFFGYWFSDTIVLYSYGARPLAPSEAPEIHEIVERLAARAKIPKPAVYFVDNPMPNAFATGRGPSKAAVAVTGGLLQILNLHEIEGVLAHEFAHIINRDTLISTIVASFAGAIYMLADMMRMAMIFGGGHSDREDNGGGALGYLFIIIVAPIVAMILQMAISRSREYKADYYGSMLAGDNTGLMSSLIKLEQGNRALSGRYNLASPATAPLCIVNPFSGRALFNIFSTHPATEDRIRELEKIRFDGR